MLRWWSELVRSRGVDAAKAFRAVEDVVRAEAREAMADYDAFVEPAKAVREGLLLGAGRSSAGEEIPVRLPWGDEHHHWLIQGGTGTGKSTWIAAILRQELECGRACGAIDCKGDVFAAMIRWTAALAHRLPPASKQGLLERLLVVNPFADHLVPLNVCRPLPGWPAEAQAHEISTALGRLFESSLGIHMDAVLRHLVLLLIEARLTLAEAPLVLENEVVRGVLAARSSNPAVKNFFLATYSVVPQISKDALLSRLQGLLFSGNVRLMLGADEVVDLRSALDHGAPMFVFLGKGPGVPEEQVEILGSLVIQLLFQATYARGSGARAPYLLAMDEFVHLLDAPSLGRRFETALTSARSFGLSLMLCHHNFAQLPAALREIILGNTDFVALFRTSERNAKFFGDFIPDLGAEDLGTVREKARGRGLELVSQLPDRHLYFSDHRKPYRAVRLRAPQEPTPYEFAGVSEAALEELIHAEGWDRGGATVLRSVLQRQIEARRERLAALVRPARALSLPGKPTDRGPTSPPKKRKPNLG
jgi:hypothetical protein